MESFKLKNIIFIPLPALHAEFTSESEEEHLTFSVSSWSRGCAGCRWTGWLCPGTGWWMPGHAPPVKAYASAGEYRK